MGQPNQGQYGGAPTGGAPQGGPARPSQPGSSNPGPPQSGPQWQGSPQTGPGQYGPSPSQPPPSERTPGRSRTGFWVALGCAVLVILLLLLAVTGGVIYLATRDGRGGSTDPGTAAPAQYSGEAFSLEYPADWFAGELTADDGSAGMVLEVGDVEIAAEDYDEFATNSVTVYLYESTLHAQKECELQATWIGFGWDETGDATAIDPVTVDGQELPAYRVQGTHDDQDAVSEMYCADVGDEVMQIVVETHGATELSPEIRAVLDSWTWAESD